MRNKDKEDQRVNDLKEMEVQQYLKKIRQREDDMLFAAREGVEALREKQRLEAEEAQERELADNFEKFLTTYVINPFANKVPQALTRLLTELNVSDSLIKEVQKNKRQRKSSAKRQ